MALTQITGALQMTLRGSAAPKGAAPLSGRLLVITQMKAGTTAKAKLSGAGMMIMQGGGYSRRLIVGQNLIGSYPAVPIPLGGADPVFTATTDPLQRSTLLLDKKTVVLVKNADSVAHSLTIRSVLDSPFNRAGDIVYSVAAGAISAFGEFNIAGWGESGYLYIDLSSAQLQVAVILLR